MTNTLLRVAGIAAVVALTASFGVAAKDVAVCGASNGYIYMPARGVVTKAQSGFQQDGFKDGSITLDKGADGKYDILQRDASGRVYSSRQQGAVVQDVASSSDSLTLVVIHDDGSSIENYLFHRTSDGADQVMWTQLRSGFMDKGGVYVASCKKLTP